MSELLAFTIDVTVNGDHLAGFFAGFGSAFLVLWFLVVVSL